MAAKLKGFNFKKLMLKHGEKLMLGITGLLVLFALVGTKWMPFKRHPMEITNAVKEARHQLENKIWPAEEQKQFEVPEGESVQELVSLIREPVDSSPFEFSQPWKFDIYGTTTPITEPELYPVQSLIADAGRAPILVNPAPLYPDYSAQELALQQQGQEGPSSTEDESEIPPEFRSRTGVTGSRFGTSAYDDYERGPRAGAGRPDDGGGGAARADRRRGAAGATTARGSARSRARGAQRGMDDSVIGLLQSGMGNMSSDLLRGAGALGKGRRDEDDDYGPVSGSVTSGSYGGSESRGQRFVAVRGVIPLRDQIRKYKKAANVDFATAEQLYQIINFELQRKKMLPDAEDPWSGEWEDVDIETAYEVLREAADFDIDVVEGMVTDSAVTMPLPMRAQGLWHNLATHPSLKEFELDEAEIELEMKFQQRLLEQHQKMQQNMPEALVEKKGFSEFVRDGRSLYGSLRGGFTASGAGRGGRADDGGGGGGFGTTRRNVRGRTTDDMEDYATGFGRGTSGRFGVRGAYQQQLDWEKFLEELEKAEGDDKKQKEALREYVQKQMKEMGAVGEMLLFRYLDFDVEPGATYQYRVRLEVTNPNYDRPSSEAAGLSYVVEGQTRKTEWSNITDAVHVPHDVDYFVDQIKTRGLNDRLVANWTLFQWDPEFGTTVAKRDVEVELGQEIGGSSKPYVLNPAIPRFEIQDYEFQSGDLFVDAKNQSALDSNNHPDLELPQGSRRDLRISNQALVVRSDGQLRVIDQLAQQDDLVNRAKQLGFEYQEYQDFKGAEAKQTQDTYASRLDDEFGEDMLYGDDGGRGRGRSAGARGRGRGRGGNVLRVTDPLNARPGEGT